MLRPRCAGFKLFGKFPHFRWGASLTRDDECILFREVEARRDTSEPSAQSLCTQATQIPPEESCFMTRNNMQR